ncbi:kinase-like domain-containing protein [Mycena sanguinolenta]|nr:kinase-like domain-containing protein [Mycena sanguinolenta]
MCVVVPSEAGVTAFLLADQIWKTLRHPNILQFLGANTLDDAPFVVMPLIPYNAREFLRARPAFDPLYILRDMSLGLEYLHVRKICHGDLKGINVLVDPLGRALLCDFGLARIKADVTSRTRTTGDMIVPGSRNWMAPELLSGSLPRKPSDVYAFGMTLYEVRAPCTTPTQSIHFALRNDTLTGCCPAVHGRGPHGHGTARRLHRARIPTRRAPRPPGRGRVPGVE